MKSVCLAKIKVYRLAVVIKCCFQNATITTNITIWSLEISFLYLFQIFTRIYRWFPQTKNYSSIPEYYCVGLLLPQTKLYEVLKFHSYIYFKFSQKYIDDSPKLKIIVPSLNIIVLGFTYFMRVWV